ncbi:MULTISPECIES: DUF2269 family protein [unclassified Virgibacillus]|uniref:DUF2269 family protein n=1 Tax=unclassified Virgibacillus TaxID=2620237 RepID=UPI0024DE40C1|nr:DUF2269 family protein [Virgibacillus sp. LDC-1]
MMLYEILVFIHVLSAIIAIGPGFMLTFIVTKAKTMTELKHAYEIRSRMHVVVMVGGILLLITGLGMGLLHPFLFAKGWFVGSLFLFIVALAMGPFVLSPLSRPIRALLAEHEGEEIPTDYKLMSKKLFLAEHVENSMLFIIVILMLWKPF